MKYIDILPGYRTDHSAITMTINLDNKEEKRGPGLWKFNSNLLTNIEYTTKVSNLIENLNLENKMMNPHQRWELAKYKIRDFSIRFAKQQAVERRKVKKTFLTN